MPLEKGKREARAALAGKEAAVARRLQGDIPLAERPFRRIGEEVGLAEGEVLTIATAMKAQGLIRKFGAIARHQLAGYGHNLMVLWAVPEEQRAEVGRGLAAFPEITHCYERSPAFAGRYSLFSMIHFREAGDAAKLREIAVSVGISDYLVLDSREEFKKISMEYF